MGRRKLLFLLFLFDLFCCCFASVFCLFSSSIQPPSIYRYSATGNPLAGLHRQVCSRLFPDFLASVPMSRYQKQTKLLVGKWRMSYRVTSTCLNHISFEDPWLKEKRINLWKMVVVKCVTRSWPITDMFGTGQKSLWRLCLWMKELYPRSFSTWGANSKKQTTMQPELSK